MLSRSLYYPCLIVLGLLLSCAKDGETGPEGPQGERGLKSLLVLDSLAPGPTCKNGGITIKSGVDKNGNNMLDETEVDNVKNVCNGDNGDYDKEIVLTLYTGSGFITGSTLCLPDFNIENYQGIDSVILVAQFLPNSTSGEVSLYNFTDNKVIENSQVYLLTQYPLQRSVNFFNSIPKKKIDLGFRMTNASYANNIRMIMYRK